MTDTPSPYLVDLVAQRIDPAPLWDTTDCTCSGACNRNTKRKENARREARQLIHLVLQSTNAKRPDTATVNFHAEVSRILEIAKQGNTIVLIDELESLLEELA